MQHAQSTLVPEARGALPRRAFGPGAYLGLMKPHVTVLLLGITLAAMTVAAGDLPRLGLVAATLVGGAMAAGSANALNCYWDRDIDKRMTRTQGRALPSGRVPEVHALLFGLLLGAGSVWVLAAGDNRLSALLALSAIVFYVVVYTMWLKRATPQNIVIGGAAGAVPVLVGWAAVTGTVSPLAWWMSAIIFLWTPPHFWALSLVLKSDYARAGVPMLPVVRGDAHTRRQIVVYSVVLVLASLLPVLVGGTFGWLYLAAAVLLGAGLAAFAVRLARVRTLSAARSLFWVSNYYLALLFAAMVLDRVLR